MKRENFSLLITLALAGCFVPICSRAQYTGGEGGGYAMTATQTSLGSNGAVQAAVTVDVFPNPAQAATGVNLTWSTAQFRYAQLLDISGRILRQYTLSGTGHSAQLPLSGLLPGSYILRLTGEAEDFRQALYVY